jgi:transposase
MSLYKKLKPGDKVCLEAGNLAFIMAKEIEKSVGCQIRVLNPSHLPIIYATDKGDALKLAHLLTDRPDSRLPVVPVPDEREMRRRKILGSYRREKQSRIRLINQLHALFVRQGIVTVVRKNLVTDERWRETVAFAYVSYINPNRFENGSQVGNYLGLVPRVDISGSLVHYGGDNEARERVSEVNACTGSVGADAV